MKVKAHLHLPRLKSGVDEVISVIPFAGTGAEYFGTVALTNVRFRVSKPGRQRTLDTGVRNVHAWVIGDVLNTENRQSHPKKPGVWRKAYYSPYQTETFIDRDTKVPVHSAKAALMVGATVYYLPED